MCFLYFQSAEWQQDYSTTQRWIRLPSTESSVSNTAIFVVISCDQPCALLWGCTTTDYWTSMWWWVLVWPLTLLQWSPELTLITKKFWVGSSITKSWTEWNTQKCRFSLLRPSYDCFPPRATWTVPYKYPPRLQMGFVHTARRQGWYVHVKGLASLLIAPVQCTVCMDPT